MHTTTSWSSPPPAWRVWEAQVRIHSAWSSTRRHRARRAAGTRSPVPASSRRWSEGGRETQKQMHVSPSAGLPSAVCRGRRAETPRGQARRNVGCSRRTQGKKQKVSAVPSHRRWGCCPVCGDWCSHIWQQVAVRSAQVHVDAFPTVHTQRQEEQQEQQEQESGVGEPPLGSLRLLLTGVKTKLFTLDSQLYLCGCDTEVINRIKALSYTDIGEAG